MRFGFQFPATLRSTDAGKTAIDAMQESVRLASVLRHVSDISQRVRIVIVIIMNNIRIARKYYHY